MALIQIPGVRSYHPAQMIVTAFLAVILTGAVLLALPISSAGPAGTRPITALFTATSAVCVTGLITVDTATYWSGFGQVVILLLIQLGGFGVMTLASLAAILVSHKLGLKSRLRARAETGALDLGDVRTVLRGVVRFTVLFEGTAAALLALWFFFIHNASPHGAIWLGIFHSISAFNNAGFALFSDNLVGFAGDPFVLIVIAFSIIAGGIGFPVMFDLRHEGLKWRRWSLHTKVTLLGTVILLVVGALFFTVIEWDNPGTLGPLSSVDSITGGFFASVTPRTAGFNAIDYGLANQSTILFTTLLMFIGAGPAGTAGGIKVTTAAVISLMVWAELRGDPDVSIFGRRLPSNSQRQALSVAALGLIALFVGTLILVSSSSFTIGNTLFEAASAFGTVGLSAGITPLFAIPPQLILIALMFVGRVGPITLGTALVLRERGRLYRFPEERPIIG